MGITGGYAGELFALLIGFGLSMLMKIISTGKNVPFNIFTEWNKNFLDIYIIVFFLLVLIFTFIYGIVNKYKWDKRLGWILLSCYILFLVAAIIIEINEVFGHWWEF